MVYRPIRDFRPAGPSAIAQRKGKLRSDSMAAVLASVLAPVLVWAPAMVSAYAPALTLAEGLSGEGALDVGLLMLDAVTVDVQVRVVGLPGLDVNTVEVLDRTVVPHALDVITTVARDMVVSLFAHAGYGHGGGTGQGCGAADAGCGPKTCMFDKCDFLILTASWLQMGMQVWPCGCTDANVYFGAMRYKLSCPRTRVWRHPGSRNQQWVRQNTVRQNVAGRFPPCPFQLLHEGRRFSTAHARCGHGGGAGPDCGAAHAG